MSNQSARRNFLIKISVVAIAISCAGMLFAETVKNVSVEGLEKRCKQQKFSLNKDIFLRTGEDIISPRTQGDIGMVFYGKENEAWVAFSQVKFTRVTSNTLQANLDYFCMKDTETSATMAVILFAADGSVLRKHTQCAKIYARQTLFGHRGYCQQTLQMAIKDVDIAKCASFCVLPVE
ncbi:TPA: hypothetical protein DDW35_07830 [Candidatus Sumerlaeota bacterium]|jgi:hypothetical protein|nr:hypothetical protein [Candidatus Sumerlaeota bacterium]